VLHGLLRRTSAEFGIGFHLRLWSGG